LDKILFQITGAVLLSYMIGSIPFGLLIGKLFYKKDIRELGSKNIGATNIMRTFGTFPGVSVLLLDALKGFLCVVFIPGLFGITAAAAAFTGDTSRFLPILISASILCGLAAIVGHNWSFFLKFKGGKGVATSIGVALALAPIEAIVAFSAFAILVFLTRYVSVGSIIGSIIFPVTMFFSGESLPLQLFGVLACVMIIIRHLPNIKRLYKGTENKIWQKKLQL